MQLGSPNLTQKCLTLSPENLFCNRKVKGQGHESQKHCLKTIQLTFDHNFANVNRFTKFFHCQILEEILCINTVKIIFISGVCVQCFLHSRDN